MLKKNKQFSFWLVFFIGYIQTLSAQNLGNSPYSKIGVGDLSYPVLAHQRAMGGSGISFTMPFFINNLNPATLSRLSKIKSTIFEAGAVGQLKNIREGEATQRDFGGGLDYITLAFPISNQFASAIGVNPYSGVNFENNFNRPVTNSDFTYDESYRGGGGLTNVFLSLGFEPYKNFRADTLKYRVGFGVRANYIFGAITDDIITKIRTNSSQADFYTAFYSRTGYSDFVFEASMLHSLNLGKERRLNFGANFNLPANVNVRRYQSVNRRTGELPESNLDTLVLIDNERGSVKLPMRATAGLSYEKEYKWAISADLSVQDWNNFQNLGSNVDTLGRSYTLNLGGQFIPAFSSVAKGFWRRTLFRAGVSYTQTPLRVDGTTINDVSISFGGAIPFGRSGAIVNLAVIGGRRGTLEKGLIRENYFRIHFGVTINDRWFLKPKFN